jgi:UDP-glucose:glycoprotein glucosyltransferase
MCIFTILFSDDKTKAHEHSEDKDDEVQGFLFSRLREMYPELEDNLAEFRKFLIDSNSEMAPLKVWQLQGMCLRVFLWYVLAI